ncbi:Uncharacterised protein [Serratia quinivorans]|nr:Uncharacterised protein [Serratia quinivorans]
MSLQTPTALVLEALQRVVAAPQHQPLLIAEFFSEDYLQQVDGNTLDYAHFMQHMALLKQLTRSMTLEIVAVAGQGDSVLTHHQVGWKSVTEAAAWLRYWHISPCVTARSAPAMS